MASENKNENVMLTGQTAYFKKNGSMTNYGIITKDTPNSSNVYGPGFVDEGSVIKAAKLETSTDYVNTLENMQWYLAEDFIAESDDYVVKTNAKNISTALEQRVPFIQNYVNNINKYNNAEYINFTDDTLDLILPIKMKPNFVLQIKSNLYGMREEYTLIDSPAFRLWQNKENEFFINDIKLPNLEHSYNTMLEITQHDNVFTIKLGDIELFECDALFNYEMEGSIDTRFAKRMYFVRIYGDDSLTYNYVCRCEVGTYQFGMYDTINNVWYPTNSNVVLFHEYESANIWSGALDLGYCPGPNTGLEVKYKQYSSISGSTYRNIVGCYSEYSVANTMSFGILVGGSSYVYGCRQNNSASGGWTSSGVISSNTDVSTVTLNKHGDGRFKSTGAMSFNLAIAGSGATIQNKGGATLWLGGVNDLGRYYPLDAFKNTSSIPCRSDIYIYNIKIYEGTTLVRDYVCATDLDDTSIKGMWDKVQNKMYPATKCSFSLRNQIN